MQLQPLARLGGGENAGSHGFDDGAGLFHELRIAGVDTLAQVQIVLDRKSVV